MNRFVKAMAALCVAGALGTAAAGNAGTQATAPTGEQMVAKVEVTATVTKIDYATREVTLKAEDGQVYSFVASEDVRNLAQVKVGDRVHVGDTVDITYTEALAIKVEEAPKK